LFSFELLEVSTKADASSLLESVEEAERAGLVFSSAESATARFEFSHELVRQAVVGGLSAARRLRLHLEVAEAIERLYSDTLEDHYPDLAHHYSRSDNVAKAVEYLGRAGQQAMRLSAYTEAISSLSAAIDLLQRLPESLERVRRELQLQLALGPALMTTKGRVRRRRSARTLARGSFVSGWAIRRSFSVPCLDCGSCIWYERSCGRPMSLRNSFCGWRRARTIQYYCCTRATL
jgi:predicted ATPase